MPATTTPLALTPGPFDATAPTADADTAVREVAVPAGTDVARFTSTSGAAGDDVDLYVYRDGVLLDGSTGSSPEAEVTVTDPAPGTYTVYVHAASAEDGSTVAGALQTWVVPGSGAAPVTLSTDAVGFAPGQRFRYSASWVGLDPATQLPRGADLRRHRRPHPARRQLTPPPTPGYGRRRATCASSRPSGIGPESSTASWNALMSNAAPCRASASRRIRWISSRPIM